MEMITGGNNKIEMFTKYSGGSHGKLVTVDWRKPCYGFQMLLRFLALISESSWTPKNTSYGCDSHTTLGQTQLTTMDDFQSN